MPPAGRCSRRHPDLPRHDAGRSPVHVRIRARHVAHHRIREGRAQLHQRAIARAVDGAGTRLDVHGHVSEPAMARTTRGMTRPRSSRVGAGCFARGRQGAPRRGPQGTRLSHRGLWRNPANLDRSFGMAQDSSTEGSAVAASWASGAGRRPLRPAFRPNVVQEALPECRPDQCRGAGMARPRARRSAGIHPSPARAALLPRRAPFDRWSRDLPDAARRRKSACSRTHPRRLERERAHLLHRQLTQIASMDAAPASSSRC